MQRAIVKKLPKVELHCHLDGSLPETTIKKLADNQQIPYPIDVNEFHDLITAPSHCTSLVEYLTRFDFVLSLLQTKEALQTAAYDLIQEVQKENVCYIEVRFAPFLSTEKGLTVEEVVEAVLTGLAEAEKDFGVKSNALLCGMKHYTADKNLKTVEIAKKYAENGIVGFDMAGDEAGHPQEEFANITALATQYGIPLTLHAGECGCSQNIATSLRQGAKRIGHGIAAIQDEAIIKQCLADKITIEMCPTSNFQTKACEHISEYPFLKFYESGMQVTINTDNRTVSGTTLTDEFLFLHQHFGINYPDMQKLTENGIHGAFLSENDKKKLEKQVKTAYQNLK